jgi:hypothetical protein
MMHMLSNNPQEQRDVTFIEAREVKRAIVGTQGLYKLASWRDGRGRQREFACRVLKMSSGVIEIAGPVTGSVGEWVTLYLHRFGEFLGPVIRVGERRLVMRIVTTYEDRRKIARKIDWIEDKKNRDNREHERLVPRNPSSTLRLSDSRVVPCQIIDYSISGAAISADIIPELGTILIVGNIVGSVVRLFSEGFAIEFIIIQDIRAADELLFTKPDVAGKSVNRVEDIRGPVG